MAIVFGRSKGPAGGIPGEIDKGGQAHTHTSSQTHSEWWKLFDLREKFVPFKIIHLFFWFKVLFLQNLW